MRTARIKGAGRSYYHCISRVIERRFALKAAEKAEFLRLQGAVADYCGVVVLTYCLMDNHFHLLVEVPEPEEVPDGEFLWRVGRLYPAGLVADLGRRLGELRRAGCHEEAERLKRGHTYRMYELSEFIKTLKQRFTQWYNRRAGRKGTLWEERFKSVLVEPPAYDERSAGDALLTMAQYIELNPVRAGLVKDPKDYRWSGYGAATGGERRARRGLVRLLRGEGRAAGWAAVRARYRARLYAAGARTDKKAGFGPEEIRAVQEAGGVLSRGQLLRCRVRYFTDGAVLGSRAFVESVFDAHRGHFGARRRTGARPMGHGDWGGLCTARDLRLAAVTPPALC